MAWTKAEKIIVISACTLLATAVTATFVICNWERPVQGIPKGWSVIGGNVDQWIWANGRINAHSTTGNSVLASSKEYRDVTMSVVASTTNREASLAIRMQDSNNGYIVIFAPAGTPCPWNQDGLIDIRKMVSGEDVILASYHGRVFSTLGKSAKIAVTVRGSVFEVRLNGVRVLRVMDSSYITGLIGLRIYGDGTFPCDATYSNLTFH